MIESSVVVRPATPDDEPRCIDLWCAAVAARDGVPEHPATRARAEQKFTAPRVALLVAAGGANRLDGFVLVSEPGTGRPTDPEDAAYLSLLAVRPDVQAHGVGRRLLVEGVTAARAAGHPAIALHALADNARAVRLYEAAGFRSAGVDFPHALTGTPTRTYVTR
ncbi:N-acetyltransferase [Curtobacterium sp. MCLR17_007]|uniref:GNAT family N-acetyltransferase n=1 Tax=Curtobacterium sp. MCLR17_007 TaxID=2175648 RepID=UPI000DA82C62|nr:N-acetyltransferase [Curtobacterium sp. MCLR17_007]WIB59371.1 N-acetyltransferase [Curtobacterium sp. MCLR17_007]